MAGDTLADVGKGLLGVSTFGQSEILLGKESATAKVIKKISGPSLKAAPLEAAPAPTPDDPAAAKAMQTAAENEQRARGRASTYLTAGRDLGAGNVFKRALLGN